MHEDRPAFGQRLAELAELGVIEFRPEPLDGIVERRLKTIWGERSCPHCGADSLHALSGSDRIWCGRCDWKTTYTRGTPFQDPPREGLNRGGSPEGGRTRWTGEQGDELTLPVKSSESEIDRRQQA